MGLGGVFLGAVITLGVLTLIHGLVVPIAQGRTRASERWEACVAELASVVRDELRRSLVIFRGKADDERPFRADPGVELLLRGNEDAARVRREREDADTAVAEIVQRMSRLSTHVANRRRRSPDWQGFLSDEMKLRVAIVQLTYPLAMRDKFPDESTWEESWSTTMDALRRFEERTEAMALLMQPPPSRRIRRVTRQVRRLVRPRPLG